MILTKIIEAKQKTLPLHPDINPLTLTKSTYNFLTAIQCNPCAIIAELKSQSPSEGIIDQKYDPQKIAVQYKQGGACALSILTDRPFFGGNFSDIQKVREVSTLPILCKDFIIDETQVYHARKNGADACLLIVQCLSAERLTQLIRCIESFDMTALVEVFDEQEVKTALQSGAKLIGVNNRNLDTLEMNPDNIAQLKKYIPDNITLLSLSGVKTPEELRHYATNYDGVLAGTALMKATDKAGFLRQALNPS